ncbi:MAG: DEAD/DEAH box helicase [Opitutales bacterium]|nr:DEAD/DEAH box helicase [Opitutales bacterium]
METLATPIIIPDLWQQRAIQALQEGKDVIVSAPTGAGKTYIFERLIEAGFAGRAVYTVPTRALANDKRMEWMHKRWDVGLQTGDRSENLDAPVVVATLETQRHRLLRGSGPDLLVIDEYQMIGDPDRGMHYELAIASAPPDTQLLLLSGSVKNPQSVASWLGRLGRDATCIHHTERPVPLEEVHVDALPDRVPSSVQGFWPRVVARALRSEMAPLITFTPQRKAAEDLAFQLARMLPEEDPLILTPEQQRLAGTALGRLLKARIAYHHSGLDYRQRAGLVEPLAKAGQLRVVVATMGLASGINFSMRSVLVTGREYRVADHNRLVRPDELLQMFGRAGRRGLDRIGYVLVAPGKPRLMEARPLHLRRHNQTDWPSLISVMQHAVEAGHDPVPAAQNLSARLFHDERIPLGLNDFRQNGAPAKVLNEGSVVRQKVVEFQNPDGDWERRRAGRRYPLAQTWIHVKERWLPALSYPDLLANLEHGSLCRLSDSGELKIKYGRELPVARMGRTEKEGELVLTRSLLRLLQSEDSKNKRLHRFGWTLDRVERQIFPKLPALTQGGEPVEWLERNGSFFVRLDYSRAETNAIVDSQKRGLINAPERLQVHEARLDFGPISQKASAAPTPDTAAEAWYQLGLIDDNARPTRRGLLFSFFNHGEGLAIAAALEDSSYPIDELVEHIANLRAGHRFSEHEVSSGRLGSVCRATYGFRNIEGYLLKGLPEGYGDGAAEWLFTVSGSHQRRSLRQSELGQGDVERVKLEWRSLLQHISNAPALGWDRWLDFQRTAIERLDQLPAPKTHDNFPPLTAAQRRRHKSFLRFD